MSVTMFIRFFGLAVVTMTLGSSCSTRSSFYLTEEELDGATCKSMLFSFGRNQEAQDLPEDRAEKVVICHVPPGNPSARKTMTIGRPAVDAHLAHGHDGEDLKDHLGPCLAEVPPGGNGGNGGGSGSGSGGQTQDPPPPPPLPPSSDIGPEEEEDVVEACQA